MSFTDEEISYIRSQPLARIATVSADGQPDVVPVVFEFDGVHFLIGGFAPERTRRTRNIDQGNNKVALVIDDLASVQPWSPRYLRVYGTVELVEREGQSGPTRIMQVTPVESWSLNLAGDWSPGGAVVPTPRKTMHATTEKGRTMRTFIAVASFSPETDLPLMNAVIDEEVAQARALTSQGRLKAVHVSPTRGRVFLEVRAESADEAQETVETLPMAKWWGIDIYPTMSLPDRED